MATIDSCFRFFLVIPSNALIFNKAELYCTHAFNADYV